MSSNFWATDPELSGVASVPVQNLCVKRSQRRTMAYNGSLSEV